MFVPYPLFMALFLFSFLPSASAQDFPLSKTLSSGHLLTFQPENSSQAPIGRLHDWVVHITNVAAKPARIEPQSVSGGMRAHGHGFYDVPRFSDHLGGGRYRVSGVLFNMPGRWQVELSFLDSEATPIDVEFEIDVLPSAEGAQTSKKALQTKSTVLTGAFTADNWTDSELLLIESLRLKKAVLSPVLSNKRADDDRAAALGHRLFFETSLSSGGDLACANCHQPGRYYTDNLASPAGSTSGRNVPSLMGVATNRFFNWDGAHDSLWSQALAPLESGAEMNMPRVAVVTTIGRLYRESYGELFAGLPAQHVLDALPQHATPTGGPAASEAWAILGFDVQSMVNRHFSNVGKTLGAYQRRLSHQSSPFDDFAATLEKNGEEVAAQRMSESARKGLRLFISDETQCMRCHNGDGFSNGGFHDAATATSAKGVVDKGRQKGLYKLLDNPFNCRGEFGDNSDKRCPDLTHLPAVSTPQLMGAFRVPSLRNVAQTSPYMHDGRYQTLTQVVRHYRDPNEGTAEPADHELQALDLNDEDVQQLVDFLGTLSGGLQRDRWFMAPKKSH